MGLGAQILASLVLTHIALPGDLSVGTAVPMRYAWYGAMQVLVWSRLRPLTLSLTICVTGRVRSSPSHPWTKSYHRRGPALDFVLPWNSLCEGH